MSFYDFGRVADIYDATRSLPEPEMRTLLGAIAAKIPGVGPIADVGVGTGRFSKPLMERGYEIVGLDISPGMMAKAREKGVRELIFADAQRTPLRDGVVESALLVHVLHLVKDWSLVLKEAARVSRGTVISVVEKGEGGAGHSLREEYGKARVEMGYPVKGLRGGEGALLDKVPPDETIPVVTSEIVRDADSEIRHMEERGQSLTWDLPDEDHKKIVESLRAKYAGTTLRSKSKICLAVWSAPKLRLQNLSRYQKG